MSITNATTSLNTAWVENAIVEFNYGPLGNVNNCITEVESKLKRGTLTETSVPTRTEVKRWLSRSKQELAETKNYSWRRRYAYASTVAGTYVYALPPDFNGGMVALRDTTNDRPIQIWPEYQYDIKFPDPSAEDRGDEFIATVKNMTLWLCPPPDGVYQLEIEYDRSGADNTTTDFTYLPEIERFRCCDFAVAESFLSLHMFQEAAVYQQKWEAGVGKARRADGKRRWRSMKYQAISMMQDFNARNHQR